MAAVWVVKGLGVYKDSSGLVEYRASRDSSSFAAGLRGLSGVFHARVPLLGRRTRERASEREREGRREGGKEGASERGREGGKEGR
eukprot:3722758-Rhodomonas_salina.2